VGSAPSTEAPNLGQPGWSLLLGCPPMENGIAPQPTPVGGA